VGLCKKVIRAAYTKELATLRTQARIALTSGIRQRPAFDVQWELPDLLIFFLWAVGMANVRGLIAPKRILSDIRSMIPDPLKGASNEDKVHVSLHELRVQRGSFDEPFINVIG
jgi:hypothetical protein